MTDRVMEVVAASTGTSVVAVERIGEEFGFAGETYRLRLEGGRSVVAKVDEPAHIRAEAWARRTVALERLAPKLLATDRDVLVTEDVTPARQGDVLAPCSPTEAKLLWEAVGKLHSRTWGRADAREWSVDFWEVSRWEDRLGRAADRYPEDLDEWVIGWLRNELPARLPGARDRLLKGPRAVVHGDLHLDNVLFRPDGSPAVVDWTRSCIGPPAIDVASLLLGGGLGLEVAFGAYAESYAEPSHAERVMATVDDAALLHVRGMVGWSGLPGALTGRPERVRASALRAVASWIRRR